MAAAPASASTSALQTRARRLRALALITCALSCLVVILSACLRLSGAGLGCADWPDCYGRVLSGLPSVPWQAARLAHRVVATLALLMGVLLVWRCRRPQPMQPAARLAGALLALMLFLSVVGIWSADPRLAAVNFINLLGGLALVTFSWRLALALDPARPAAHGEAGPLCRLAFAALALTVLLGGLIGARYAATACGTLPACEGAWWPTAGWSALHPFVTLTGPAGPGDAGGVALHLLHRYAAVLTAALLIVVALRSPPPARNVRRAALAALALLLLEGLTGALTVASGFSLWLAVAHNLGAALLMAAAASLMHSARQ
ncbi:MAG: COX15/CtaA family protein [Zoogloeaceae bacterium]|jgi:heme A synthase|nr:COX15/CtaA family protein [Zoogloeaceae bacterium]